MIEPYYQDDSATIYHCDCREILPELDPVDHVITDPPFEAEAHTLQRRRRADREKGISYEPLTFDVITEDLRQDVCRLLNVINSGWFLAFCQIEAVQKWRECIEVSGGKYKRACLWIKPDGMPQFSGDRPGMGYETFVAAWQGDGKSKWNGGGKHGVYRINKGGDERTGHQTQKPVKLMKNLIVDFTNSGQLILDPFAGSFTTAVAAKALGCKCIAIEKEEKYCEIGVKRLAQEVLPL